MCAKDVAITVLADNRAAYGLEAQHGLSLWIETAGHKILFDTGAAFQAYDVHYLYPCHYTAEGTVSGLRQRLGASVQPGFAGMKISF